MRNISIAMFVAAAATLPLAAQHNGTPDLLHVAAIDHLEQRGPAPNWAPQDPADPIWRAGREAINDRAWTRAADQFKRIRTENGFRNSVYRGQSYYWEAYARAQIGGSSQLRQARQLLEDMQENFPQDARSIRDVPSLLASIEGRLSKDYGDEPSAARLRESVKAGACPDMDDDDNPRAVALNALLMMDVDAAMPILENIMSRREECSEALRAKAIWMIAQKKTPRAADILLETIQKDPSDEVRAQAVFWLSQVDSEKAVTALESILRSSAQRGLHENALFALSQNRSPRAVQMLREYAGRNDIPSELRANAILWIGQSGKAANIQFLKELFAKIDDNEGREQILMAIAQSNSGGSGEWLMNVATDTRADIEIRKQALFWFAQSGAAKQTGEWSAKLVSLYSSMNDRDMKEQLIFVYAQRRETVFIDKLMDIAKNDKDPELRKTAIFWLGQVGSKDPRVVKFLVDMING